MQKPRTYKALILDIDGTTVKMGRGNFPSAAVTHAVSGLIKRGVSVSIATGRNIDEAAEVIEKLGITSTCMLANGAILYEPSTKKMIECTPIDKQSLEKIRALIEPEDLERFIVVGLYTEQHYGVAGFGDIVVALFIEKLSKERAQMYVKKLKDIPTIQAHTSDISYNEGFSFVAINEVRATKQRALAHLLKNLQIAAEEVVAVGDGENDLPMVIAAGMGVAMGNAAEGLKAVADYIAPSVDEDGVAHVIDKFFPEG